MPESLKDLSDRATPGELYVTGSQDAPERDEEDYGAPWYTLNPRDEEQGVTLTSDPELGGWCTDGGNSGYTLRKPDAEFLAALWNAYRAGQLHDDTALSQARADALAQGRREGLKEAAKVVEAHHDGFLKFSPECEDEAKALSMAWLGIHRLATAPAETQKPETGGQDA